MAVGTFFLRVSCFCRRLHCESGLFVLSCIFMQRKMGIYGWLAPFPRADPVVDDLFDDLFVTGLLVFLSTVPVLIFDPLRHWAWMTSLIVATWFVPVARYSKPGKTKPLRHKRKRKLKPPSMRQLKQEVKQWARKAARRQKSLISCRHVQKRRLKRTRRERNGLKHVQW